MLKALAQELLPPLVYRALRASGAGNAYKGDYNTWDDAVQASQGYDDSSILEKVLSASLAVKNGAAAYERDSVLFDQIEYAWPVTASLMWVAAQHNGRLNVLDFGGSLGSSYFQNRKFLQSLDEVSWQVVEQPHYVQTGKDHLQDERLRFFFDIKEAVDEALPDVVLLSSVLQYLESPYELLDEIEKIGTEFLIIDRNPVAPKPSDRILIQEVPPAIYEASYPFRVFSEKKLLEALEGQWTVIEKYSSLGGVTPIHGGGQFEYTGMTLRRKRA